MNPQSDWNAEQLWIECLPNFPQEVLDKFGLDYNKEITPPVWVAQLDGIVQYWQLTSPLTAENGEDFRLKVKAERGDRSAGCFLMSSMDASNYGINIYSTGDYSLGEGKISVFGLGNSPFIEGLNSFTDLDIEVSRESGVWTVTVNGVSDTKTPTSEPPAIATSTETNLGRRVEGGFYSDGYVSDLEYYVNGVLTNKIPLTVKEQGATQLATVGDINAFMPNYTEAVWKEV